MAQVNSLLHARLDVQAASISLIDPGIPGYLASGKATFASGELRGVPVRLLPMGAEMVPACYARAFDTVAMLNVIEHTFNAFATLHTAHRLLKPGGLFVFHERIVRQDAHSQIYHPVRLSQPFFDAFLAEHYEEIYRRKGPLGHEDKPFIAGAIYFMGRKRAAAAAP